MISQHIVIFGATGGVGTALCEILSREYPNCKIQAVSRSTDGGRLGLEKLPNVEIVQGDIFDAASVKSITESSDVIFCCVGFTEYKRKYWAQRWPLVTENLLATVTHSESTKTKLVFQDNLYAYGPGTQRGPQDGRVPAGTHSKPAVRALLHERFQKHMTKFPGTLAVVGASDFVGQHVGEKSMLGDTFMGKIVQGSTPLCFGSKDAKHDFCFVPDVARALALAVDPDHENALYDSFWVVPNSIQNQSMHDLANRIATLHDPSSSTDKHSVSVLGVLSCYLLGLFIPFLWEIIEMMPFWKNDYSVDDTGMRKAFGLEPTAMDDALRDMLLDYTTATPSGSQPEAK